ncbi:MAG: hypothetical protein JKY09_07380 [Crocinitomicaceae bacterium]|nr:hypothetical protein [Crocinitomicaceae bacterium]
MKKRNILKMVTMSLILVGMTALTSCKKYKKFDNKEVIENTFTGNIDVTSGGEDPAGDFTGNGDSGEYSFAWVNSSKKASVNFDITTNTGSVQMILLDAKGNEVLNETRSAGGNDSYSGVSEEGKAGTWKVTIILTDFNGDGSYSIHPGN